MTAHEGRLRHELIMSSPVAQLVVGADLKLVLVNHRARTMLGLSERDVGRSFPGLDITATIVGLGPTVATALARRDAVALREVPWRHRGGPLTYLDVETVPLLDTQGDVLGLSITLTDVTRFHEVQVEVETANRQLESAYQELRSTNEELETTNEELLATVEELQTTNEELQSTNAELETMNEELQSTHDELQLTDEQLRDRSFAVTRLNDLMQSIFTSLDAAVIVVDRDLMIQALSRQAEELWGLREGETVGQQLLSLDSGLPLGALRPWLRTVIEGSEPGISAQHIAAVNRRGRRVDLRVTITPMTTGSNEPTGALLLFEDSTSGIAADAGPL